MDHPTAMHVARIKSRHTRSGGQRGDPFLPAGQPVVAITRSVPHGHVAAAYVMACELGVPVLLGPAGRQRDLALALIISRVVHPFSKLPSHGWWHDTTLGADFGIADATADEAQAAMDWLVTRQETIEKELARRHLAPEANPQRMALFDLSSSWLEDTHCPLGASGYSRHGKKGAGRIEYGLLTDAIGRPVAVRVFDGDTAVFTEITSAIKDIFGLKEVIVVDHRSRVASSPIEALRDHDGKYGWVTALRAHAIRKLIDDGPLQLTLFDEQDLAEIASDEFPGERLIACHNPALAEERARKRESLLVATEKLLGPVIARVAAGRLTGTAEIGEKTGEVIGKYKMTKHFRVTITGTSLTAGRDQASIDAEARLDGIYVIRTPVPSDGVVERGFRLENRVKGYVLICMLAAYLTWHLRQAWVPLTRTDEEPTAQASPVLPAKCSAAEAEACGQHHDHGHPYLSYQGLLDHLGTLARNELRFADEPAVVTVLTEPTSRQREAFDLIGTAVPLTLTN